MDRKEDNRKISGYGEMKARRDEKKQRRGENGKKWKGRSNGT